MMGTLAYLLVVVAVTGLLSGAWVELAARVRGGAAR